MERRNNTSWMEPQIDLDNGGGRVEIPIGELLFFLTESKAKGATDVVFTGESEYDSYSTLESLEIQPVKIEPENDEEYKQRIEAEEHRRNIRLDAIEQKEIAEYDRLRQKYGD